MSERRECFCGRRTVFEFGLTDDGNAHTWRFCGKDGDGQGLDVNTLLSERMEQVERAEKAEAQVQAVREACDAAFPINDIGTRVVTLSAILYALDGGVPLDNYGDDIVYLDGGDA